MEVITSGQIYWLTRCDALKGFFFSGAAGCGFVCIPLFSVALVLIMCGVFSGNDRYGMFSGKSDEATEAGKKRLRKYGFRSALLGVLTGIIGLLFGAVSALVPTTKEMAAIVVIPHVANSESVQGIGQGIVDLAQDWMSELHPNKVKETVKEVAKEVSK